jgi:hypothetical protein
METKVLPDIKIAEAEFEDLQKLQQVLFFFTDSNDHFNYHVMLAPLEYIAFKHFSLVPL